MRTGSGVRCWHTGDIIVIQELPQYFDSHSFFYSDGCPLDNGAGRGGTPNIIIISASV